jgi:hypothetical protein
LPLELAQDLLHSSRRRRSWYGSHLCCQAVSKYAKSDGFSFLSCTWVLSQLSGSGGVSKRNHSVAQMVEWFKTLVSGTNPSNWAWVRIPLCAPFFFCFLLALPSHPLQYPVYSFYYPASNSTHALNDPEISLCGKCAASCQTIFSF